MPSTGFAGVLPEAVQKRLDLLAGNGSFSGAL
jgi:hypothetical protein